MASIADFVQHRIEEGRITLRQVDPAFFQKIEATVKLESMGLMPPWEIDPNNLPTHKLSTEWHNLLESCFELIMQNSRVEVAALGFMAVAYSGLSDIDAGKRVDFNLRTWFIHAHNLAERVQDIISKTANVHLTSKAEKDKTVKRFRLKVKNSVLDLIEDTRNEFAHGGRRSSARGLTEGELWEPFLPMLLTPEEILDKFFYARMGQEMKAGMREFDKLMEVLEPLGVILHQLEVALGLNDK